MRLYKGSHYLVRALFIMMSLHCIGLQGQNHDGYSIDVNTYVSVRTGHCVAIPCNFTADNKNRFTNSRGYWMRRDGNDAVVKSDVTDQKYGEPQTNFHFTGNPDEGDCTLTITNARKTDSARYYFRFEGLVIYSYTANIFYLDVRGPWSQNTAAYSIAVARNVSVQEGQCVTIPCTFTANCRTRFTNSRGYWMIDGETAVARSDATDDTYGIPRTNFHLTGNPDKGDCTLIITDAKKTDSGKYFFRFDGPPGYSYLTNKIHLSVEDLTDKPEIKQSGLLVVGQKATLTCIAPGNCPGKPPSFKWKKNDIDDILGESSNWTFSTNLSHHQMNITCEVQFTTAKTSAQKTLEVMYPPQKAEVKISLSTGGFQYTGETVIIQNDEPPTLQCSADGNPPAKVSWIKGTGEQVQSATITTNSTEDETYTCVASNEYGSSNKTLKVIFEASTNGETNTHPECGNRILDIFIGMFCGIALIVVFKLLFKFIAKRGLKRKTEYGSPNENPPNEDATTDSNMIYMNVKEPEQTPEDTEDEEVPQEDVINLTKDQEDLYYSDIHFPIPPIGGVNKQPEAEYAEVKRKDK